MSIAPHLTVLEERASYIDQDGLWKKIVTDLFEPFTLFFAPELYENIDWNKKYDSLEQELPGTFPKKKGKKYSDKLMKVHLKDGKEQWILIHVEVQSSRDDDFSERMFQYFSRIFNAYHRKIYAIAVLADDQAAFNPTTFTYNFYGTHLTYGFNTYKLLGKDKNDLLQSDNPFAFAVLAGIYMIESKNNASLRYQFKRQLLQLLLAEKDHNWSHEDIASLFYFIDFLLEIPKDMTRHLRENIISDKEAILMNQAMNSEPSPTLKDFIDMKKEGWRQEGKEAGREEGNKEGKEDRTREMAKAMLAEGIPLDKIMKITELNEHELKELMRNMS